MIKIIDKFKFESPSKILASKGKTKGAYPFYTSSKLQSKFIDEFNYEGESIILGTGGSPSIHFQDKKFSVSSDCVVLQSQSYSVKLLYYYLFGNIHLLYKGFQGAGLQHISKRYIEKIVIPDFESSVQNEIVATLDKIQSLIDKRKKTIFLFDEILYAHFMDRFWIKNENFSKWTRTQVSEVLIPKKGSRTGPFGSNLLKSEILSTGEVAVLGIDNAVNNIFQWGEKRFITSNKYETLKQFKVNPRDIIITIMGTVGRSAVLPDTMPPAINTKHLAILTVDETKCNPYYLSYAIHSDPFIRFQIQHKKRGAIMDGINLNIIRNLQFSLPPIELQNKFEETYKFLLSSQNKRKYSLEILEEMFKSFIQIVFSDKRISNVNELNNFLKDHLLQQELFGKLSTGDFLHYEEYSKAKKILFELLESGESILTQTYNEEKDQIEIVMN